MFCIKPYLSLLTKIRRKNVRKKLNAMALEFVDKKVLLVDGMSYYPWACTAIAHHALS